MKIILTAINAKYIHTNLAVRYLQKCCQEQGIPVEIAEYTINHRTDALLSALYRESPDIVAFSCYIWNMEFVKKLGPLLKTVLPQVKILLGGPDVSFDSERILEEEPWADYVLRGEGEATLPRLLRLLTDNADCRPEKELLNEIPGITFREEGNPVSTPAPPLCSMDRLPFPYDDLTAYQNRILYYEASRGCPFSCQYCLSSEDKQVRFRSLSLVFADLKKFLDAKVPQVKFVDRTFNARRDYALSILRFLKEHDNGVTNFHFELCAELLDEETLTFLQDVRPGQFQFEIGVQSTNPETLTAIRRRTDYLLLKERVARLIGYQNAHVHLDLIAGLPFEGYGSFARSYNDVYALRPHMLQLGFLKLLKGSGLYRDREQYGIVCQDAPPYEVLYTKHMSYAELLRLKDIEELTERYYNSMRYPVSLAHLVSLFPSPFAFFESLAWDMRQNGLLDQPYSSVMQSEHLLRFFEAYFPDRDSKELKYRLLHDMNRHEKLKNIPGWLIEVCDESAKAELYAFLQDERERNRLLPEYDGLEPRQVYRQVQALRFPFDPLGKEKSGPCTLLYNYRRPTLCGASVYRLPQETTR